MLHPCWYIIDFHTIRKGSCSSYDFDSADCSCRRRGMLMSRTSCRGCRREFGCYSGGGTYRCHSEGTAGSVMAYSQPPALGALVLSLLLAAASGVRNSEIIRTVDLTGSITRVALQISAEGE